MSESTTLENTKCSLHPHREAAAQCPQCRRFYCRECVVEHDGRMLCNSCIDEDSHDTATKKRSILKPLIGICGSCISIALIWTALYWFGVLLKSIPEEFHDNPSEYSVQENDG